MASSRLPPYIGLPLSTAVGKRIEVVLAGWLVVCLVWIIWAYGEDAVSPNFVARVAQGEGIQWKGVSKAVGIGSRLQECISLLTNHGGV
jgi:hypothetical protein